MPSVLSPPLARFVLSRAFVLAWLGVYWFFYVCLEGVTRLLFRPLFLVRRVGRPPRLPDGPVILCPNHQSYLDPAFVQNVVRRRLVFVMTNDFYAARSANWFFRLVGAIPVGSRRLSWGGMRRAAALLRLGGALVLFPEGRLSLDGTIGRAQRGVAVIARRGRAPVIPVAIEGSIRAWPHGARWLKRANVRIAFGEPLVFTGPATREAEQAFANEVLDRVAALKTSLRPIRN